MDIIPDRTEDQIVDLYFRVADLARTRQNERRTGTVHEVDYARRMARLKLRDREGKPVLTPWSRWEEPSNGDLSFHTPLTVGEQMDIVSESGDLTDGVIRRSTEQDRFKRPHNAGDLHVIDWGSTRVEIGPEVIKLRVGGSTVTITADSIRSKSTRIVEEGDVFLGGESGGEYVHRKNDADSLGDIAVGHAKKVYAV